MKTMLANQRVFNLFGTHRRVYKEDVKTQEEKLHWSAADKAVDVEWSQFCGQPGKRLQQS